MVQSGLIPWNVLLKKKHKNQERVDAAEGSPHPGGWIAVQFHSGLW